ncbi:MAG TPA: TIGR02757 family protein [Spirochaetales bacterium]|nr:TIGR02757 family protein [Spirochaetales bacterium]HRY55398.1 TIGR02757 family protein [Spirochaetia bacterium]
MRAPAAGASPQPRRDPGLAAFLEDVYAACGRAGRLRSDPLALVAPFSDPADRELAALVCSTLAFGSVRLIMRACREALGPLGPRPASALDAMGETVIARTWSGFQYRYCFAKDISALMLAAGRARAEAGSLLVFFRSADPGGPDLAGAASAFVRGLGRLGAARMRPGLLADPAGGSACKRIFLMLRWLVRRDAVDPGGWEELGRERLVVPLDTHMARVCSERLGFIRSPAPTLANALAATAAFRLYAPEDPVKYDFALTRPGIDPEPGDERFGCD